MALLLCGAVLVPAAFPSAGEAAGEASAAIRGEAGDVLQPRATASTVTGTLESFEYAPFLSGRRCWIYLPPGYDESTESYPVLYMHDGDHLFDEAVSPVEEWRVDETCETLISGFEIEPIIVVGIENSADRCVEYTPWWGQDPDILCWAGGGGDAYLAAIIDDLIPEINRRYRTRTGPENTYMAGSSLGGLISIYAGYEHDDVFGRVAALSTYFPWADHELLAHVAGRDKPALERFYIDMGTREYGFTDRDTSGVDDYIEDLRAMRDIALAQGFLEGEDFLSVEAALHRHLEFYWALRFPDVLRFLVDSPSVTTGIDDVPPVRSTVIRGVAPNPFRSSTRIDLALGESRHVQGEIYDVAGRLVRRLVDGDLPAGNRSFDWNGRHDDGRPAGPGIYWIRFRSGAETLGSTRLVRLP